MKTYLRLFQFARPFSSFIPEYLILSMLGIAFGLINFPILIPLLDMLNNPAQIPDEISKPAFTFSFSYITGIFQYYFNNFLLKFGEEGALWYLCGMILVCILMANICRYWAQRVLARMRTRMVKRLRHSVFEKLITVHHSYFQKQRKGELLSVVSNDIQEIESTLINSIQAFIRDPIAIVFTFTLLFIISTRLTLFTILLLPASAFIISTISRKLKKKSVKSQSLLGDILSSSEEAVSGSKIIKAFNAEKEVLEKFGKDNERYRKITKGIFNQREMASPISEFLGVTVAVVVLLYSSHLILRGESSLSTGGLVAYLLAYAQVLSPAKNISAAITNIQRGLAAGDRVFRIIDTPIEILETPGAKTIHGFNRQIEYRNISFGYEEKSRALNSIQAVIPKGKIIALVGPSGSGKTTFADLLPRFYDPTAGGIFLDDINIKEYKLSDLRGLMGIVTQEPILFNDTVFNNIALGMKTTNQEEVITAAKVANAHDFISRMEKGYDTIIGDRGNRLSGGEKQRLTIARAVLKNPPILILDEATSSLDTESEKLVQDALYKLMKNRTCLVIAHRLSTIQNADEILVLRKGEIEERGTHADLISANGLYKHLVDLQML